MKYFKIKTSSALISIILFCSCEGYFGDVNLNPDEPTDVPVSTILPQVQVRLAYTLGGDFSRYIGVYTQHVDGVGRQFEVIGKYGIQSADVNTLWQNCYSGVMMDNRKILEKARNDKLNHYMGVSKAIEAYTIMLTTDFWGDVPYSESFQGKNLIQPKFDTQESIYNEIFNLLDSARILFNLDAGPFSVGSDDLIYKGKMDKWKIFCNVLEARGRLHLAKKDNSNYQLALDALNKGAFSSSEDDAKVGFGTSPTAQSPWYQYIQQRDDCEVGAGYKNILDSLNDPRDLTYGFEHIIKDPNNKNNDDFHPIFKKAQPVILLSYTEAKFIEAECKFNVSGSTDAHPAYIEGVTSSFTEALVPDSLSAYIAKIEVDPGTSKLTLDHIITQKYIALYTQPEVFNDWRRTNLPALTPIIGKEIPRRLPYADSEIQSNLNTPSTAEVTIFSKVWWDQ